MNVKDSFSLKGKVKITGRNKKGEIVSETPWFDNLVMFGSHTGRALFLDRLAGVNTYSLNITTCGIGTSQATPTVADTALGASVAVASSPVITTTSNVVSFQFFFADGVLANGTYYEVGTFVDGTQLFNHALFASGYVKTAGIDTTIQIDFTSN